MPAGGADGESAARPKVDGMPEPDRAEVRRCPGTLQAGAPTLSPRPGCGTPADARDVQAACFFQGARQF